MRRDHERRQPTLGVNSVLLINYAEFAFIEIPETSTSIINYGLLSLSLSLSSLIETPGEKRPRGFLPSFSFTIVQQVEKQVAGYERSWRKFHSRSVE